MRKGVLKVTVCCLMGCILLANPFMTVDVYSLSGALPVAGSASVLNGSRDGNTTNKNTSYFWKKRQQRNLKEQSSKTIRNLPVRDIGYSNSETFH